MWVNKKKTNGNWHSNNNSNTQNTKNNTHAQQNRVYILCIYQVYVISEILQLLQHHMKSILLTKKPVIHGQMAHTCNDITVHISHYAIFYMRGIHQRPVNSPHKGPLTQKCFHLMTSSWIFWQWPETVPVYLLYYHTLRQEHKKANMFYPVIDLSCYSRRRNLYSTIWCFQYRISVMNINCTFPNRSIDYRPFYITLIC